MLIMQIVIELSTEEINSDVGKMPREQMRKNRNEAIHKKSETPGLFCVFSVTSFIIFNRNPF